MMNTVFLLSDEKDSP